MTKPSVRAATSGCIAGGLFGTEPSPPAPAPRRQTTSGRHPPDSTYNAPQSGHTARRPRAVEDPAWASRVRSTVGAAGRRLPQGPQHDGPIHASAAGITGEKNRMGMPGRGGAGTRWACPPRRGCCPAGRGRGIPRRGRESGLCARGRRRPGWWWVQLVVCGRIGTRRYRRWKPEVVCSSPARLRRTTTPAPLGRRNGHGPALRPCAVALLGRPGPPEAAAPPPAWHQRCTGGWRSFRSAKHRVFG